LLLLRCKAVFDEGGESFLVLFDYPKHIAGKTLACTERKPCVDRRAFDSNLMEILAFMREYVEDIRGSVLRV
jgi:hypothetical protein